MLLPNLFVIHLFPFLLIQSIFGNIKMNNKVFASCAVTGSGYTAGKHPDLPKTPEQIAKAVIEDTW